MRFGHKVSSGGLVPLADSGDGRWRDVSSVVPSWSQGHLARSAMDVVASRLHTLPEVDEPTTWGPCVVAPRQIVCVGLNYHDHAVEAGMSAPPAPIIFARSPHSLTGPTGPVVLPPGSTRCDWEVELALVVGISMFGPDGVDPDADLAGYCLALDISELDWQLNSPGQWTIGKSYPSFCPVGPWGLTPASAPGEFQLTLEVNGTTMQDGTTADLIFPIADVLTYLAQHMRLEPGDLVLTGTPAGVGMATGTYLKEGDDLHARATGLGSIECTVVRADDIAVAGS